MTITGHGLRTIEVQRDRTDLAHTGRRLRLVPESGGEIALLLSARALRELRQAIEEAEKSLERTPQGWRNVEPRPGELHNRASFADGLPQHVSRQ